MKMYLREERCEGMDWIQLDVACGLSVYRRSTFRLYYQRVNYDSEERELTYW
jgi:hypothetical protein